MLNGGGGLAYTPVIDFRGYADMQPGGNDHPRFMSFSTKERLLKANGHLDNFVMLTVDGDQYGLFSTNDPQVQEAFRQMDSWLTALVQDASDEGRSTRPGARGPPTWWTRAGRRCPGAAEDRRGAEGLRRAEPLPGAVSRRARSRAVWPARTSATDIIKCQLKPIAAGRLHARRSRAAEMDRLQRIFPDGVCDWSKPGVAQRKPLGPWYVVPGTPPAG